MNNKLIHYVYFEDGALYKHFTDSVWYDTATPYQHCVYELKEIKNTIKGGYKLKIESFGKVHIITTIDEFKSWVENVFLGGFEEHVFASD